MVKVWRGQTIMDNIIYGQTLVLNRECWRDLSKGLAIPDHLKVCCVRLKWASSVMCAVISCYNWPSRPFTAATSGPLDHFQHCWWSPDLVLHDHTSKFLQGTIAVWLVSFANVDPPYIILVWHCYTVFFFLYCTNPNTQRKGIKQCQSDTILSHDPIMLDNFIYKVKKMMNCCIQKDKTVISIINFLADRILGHQKLLLTLAILRVWHYSYTLVCLNN